MDPLLFFLTAAVGFGYIRLLFWIMKGWDDTDEWNVSPEYQPRTTVSIIVAARNEEAHIRACVESLLQQLYPAELMEIIIVDDHSTDGTLALLKNTTDPRLKVVQLTQQSGKKAALTQAVQMATGSLIACTDADCLVPERWLQLMVSYYEINKPRLMAGPIQYQTDRSLVQRFQYLDGVGNMAITAAGIHYQAYFMANGANIVYEKSLFDEVGGYTGDGFASGDDMMLIQKTANYQRQHIRYLKQKLATVVTTPQKSVDALVTQRKRWASKSSAYIDKGIVRVQAYVFFVIVCLLANILLIPFTNGFSLFCFLFLLFIKWGMDFLFLHKMAQYFGDTKPLKSFFPASVWFVGYILWAAYSAAFPSDYQWKGRSVK